MEISVWIGFCILFRFDFLIKLNPIIGNTNFFLAPWGEDAQRASEGLLIPELRIFLFLEVIVVEHTDEGGNFLDGIGCILGYLLVL